MTTVRGVPGGLPGPGVGGPVNRRLWKATHDLEGVFMSQLFQAMRATVPEEEGILPSSTAEDLFSSMLDETMGRLAAQRMRGGLGEALYRDLSRHLHTREP